MTFCCQTKMQDSMQNDIELSLHGCLEGQGDQREKYRMKSKPCLCILRIRRCICANLLLVLTMAGILAGFVVGLTVRLAEPSTDAIMWIGLPGDIFMRMLKMLILPLIVCSVISGMSTLDPKSNGKISLISFIFIVVTNTLGAIIGIGVSMILKAQVNSYSSTYSATATTSLQPQDVFADLIRNIFPDNIISAAFSQAQTQYTERVVNSTNGTITVVVKSVGTVASSNLIGLVVISLLIAVAINRSGTKGKPVLQFFQSAADLFLILLQWIIWSTPIGVFSLIAASLAGITKLEKTFLQVGYLVLAVSTGVVFHQVILMPLIYYLTLRKNPYRFLIQLAKPWLIAFASTSTAVAIPEMFDIVESKAKVDKRISRFVIPFSVTLSANGAAIFIASAAVFMAMVSNVNITSGDYVMILILTSIGSLCIPSVPSASIVTLLIILTSIRVPHTHIGLLFAVEWFLDRIRTTSSVVSHSFCAVITHHLCVRDLPAITA